MVTGFVEKCSTEFANLLSFLEDQLGFTRDVIVCM